MVEPLVVSPSGVDAIALGDNAAFEHNGVLVQHDGIGAGEVGRSLAFVRDPRFVGTGFFAGEAPDGLTTVYGDPISADVFVYWRDPDDPMAQEVLVGATKSAPDGTWLITGLNYNLQYVIRARASGRDDVTVVGARPSRSDVITYEGEFTNNEYFDGVAGEILIASGLTPFAATIIQPLPYGLLPVIDGRKLIIDGTSDDGGIWNSVVRVTASNAVFVDVPVQVVILKAPDITVRYAAAGDWTITLQLSGGILGVEVLRVYRSTEPLDLEALPEHVAELDADAEQWVDTDVEPGQTYYYAVGAYVGGVVAMSAVVEREAVWTPAELTVPPQIWLDDESIEVNGSKVVRWRSRSGEALDFTAVANKRPDAVVNSIFGRSVVSFDGIDDALSCATPAARRIFKNVGAGWVFACYKKRAVDVSAVDRTLIRSDAPGGKVRLGLQVSSPLAGANRLEFGVRRLDSDSFKWLGSTESSAGRWILVFAQQDWSTGTGRIYIDGDLNAESVALTSAGVTSNTEPVGVGIVIGSDGASRYADADVACVLVGSGAAALSISERLRIEGWAAHRYGLTSNLPPDHPYKSVAP